MESVWKFSVSRKKSSNIASLGKKKAEKSQKSLWEFFNDDSFHLVICSSWKNYSRIEN